MGVRARFVLASAVAFAACKDREAPPLPEVLVVADTNLPAPLVAGRLRVDLYEEDGTWFDSSDFGRPDPRDWPASFSVYSDDESRDRTLLVRLRVYPEGAVSSYTGERFREGTTLFDATAGNGQPRLVKDGRDVTPSTEPSPELTVDRLVRVVLHPEKRGRLQVLLDGACLGTMVNMGESTSCVSTPGERDAVTESPIEDDMSRPTTSQVGTWLAMPCPPPVDGDTRVCIPGGATILGSRENSDFSPGQQRALDPAPPRAFGLSTFFIDRDELSVGMLRQMVKDGYDGPLPIDNALPLADPLTNAKASCTFTLANVDRDGYPVTCVDFTAARSICQARGGDLPTEAQWEHAATIAGHRQKQRYPWGDDLPTCDRGVYGHAKLGAMPAPCPGGPLAPLLDDVTGDVSPLGVKRLFGSAHEWVLDEAAEFVSPAWAAVALVDPVAKKDSAKRVFRGSSWMSDAGRPTFRWAPDGANASAPVGFRCAYPVTP